MSYLLSDSKREKAVKKKLNETQRREFGSLEIYTGFTGLKGTVVVRVTKEKKRTEFSRAFVYFFALFNIIGPHLPPGVM